VPLSQLPAVFKSWLPTTTPATTLGIRSEAIHLATTDQPHLTATVTQQIQLGRDVQTYLQTTMGLLISTAIPTTTAATVAVTLDPTGCTGFAADGHNLAGGDRDA